MWYAKYWNLDLTKKFAGCWVFKYFKSCFDIKNNKKVRKKGVKVDLRDFSEYPSPQTKNGVHFLTPLYVLIATKFSVRGGSFLTPQNSSVEGGPPKVALEPFLTLFETRFYCFLYQNHVFLKHDYRHPGLFLKYPKSGKIRYAQVIFWK